MKSTKATYQIIYNSKNITVDIVPFITGLTYIDNSTGETDEIEIALEDSTGLWRNEWYPEQGDTIIARIFFEGNTLDCGSFTVDEITGTGSVDGDSFSIKAIAAGINKSIRTNNSYAHENKSLREIVNTVAANHGLQVVGEIEDIRISRVHQYREGDLKFLQRLGNEYGYVFSLRDSKLIFTNIFAIENKNAALTIRRNEIINYSITDKTANTFKKARVNYHNPKEKKIISHELITNNKTNKHAKVDTLELRVRAENQQQAEIKARVALYRANSLQQEGSIEMPGNVFALAGNNCELIGIGQFSGIYYIQSSTHSVTKDGGYTTGIEIKRVGLVEQSKHKL